MVMKTLAATAALAALIGLGAWSARAEVAAVPASAGCVAPETAHYGRLKWFLGLHPSDDLLTAWCRLQALPGNVRFNVQWPYTNVHRSWDTAFTERLPASRIVEIVQSTIPLDDVKVVSETGVPFNDVLANAVQLQADKAPDGTTLDFAATHPAATQIALWEPLGLRVKPVVLAGQEFTLSVYLKPNLGMLSLALAGQATDVRVRAWSGWFQTGNFFKTDCSSLFPACGEIPQVATVHLPLVVDTVRLEATGDNMTASAVAIGRELYARNAGLAEGDPMASFDTTAGRGSFSLNDDHGELLFEADGTAGTESIRIVYRATEGENSVLGNLARIGEAYRGGTGREKSAPTAPDSLGRL